jgi:hypothetical protein
MALSKNDFFHKCLQNGLLKSIFAINVNLGENENFKYIYMIYF